MTARSLSDQAAIVGIGQTEFSKNSGRSELQLAAEASLAAIRDAGLDPSDIDGMATFTLDSSDELLLMRSLGLQEVKSQPQNLASDLWTGEDVWTSGLRASLASSGYIKVRSIRLVGTVLSLFSLARHLPHIRGQYSFQF